MPLQKHLTLLVAVALAVALVSREFGAPRDVVRRRARGWLKELRASIALNASRADGRRRFEPSLRYWFCFQPFKASAPDWPLVERYHTCHNRSKYERSGALFRD